MDPQKVLSSLAADKGLPLTNLIDVSTKYCQSAKISCCGGLMTRVVTESSADSTVLLRDGSGSCYCALHGDITSRYPDVLSSGALLLLTDVTLLVLSSKVPPVLMACLPNLAGLLLPDEHVAGSALAHQTPGQSPSEKPLALPQHATGKDSWRLEGLDEESGTFMGSGGTHTMLDSVSPLTGGHVHGNSAEMLGGRPFDVRTPAFTQGGGEGAITSAEMQRRVNPIANLLTPPLKMLRHEAGAQQMTTDALCMGGPTAVAYEVDAEDDEDCLEFVDDL